MNINKDCKDYSLKYLALLVESEEENHCLVIRELT